MSTSPWENGPESHNRAVVLNLPSLFMSCERASHMTIREVAIKDAGIRTRLYVISTTGTMGHSLIYSV